MTGKTSRGWLEGTGTSQLLGGVGFLGPTVFSIVHPVRSVGATEAG